MYSLVFLCHKDDLLYWQYYLLGSTGKQFGNTASAIKGPVPDSKDWLLLALHSTAWHRLNVLHANSKSSVLCQILPFQGIFKHSPLNVTIQTVSEQANYSSYLAPFQKEDFARSEQAHMDTHTCRGANIQRHTYTCRGAHTHIKRHVHVQTQTHTHTQHPTKSPFTNLTFQGHTWDDARFPLPLSIPRLLPSASYDICYIQRDTKSSDSLSPLPPATTKPKHTLSPTETVTKQRVIFSEQFNTQLYTLLELNCPALLGLSFSPSFLWTQHSSSVTGLCWSIIFSYFHVIKTTSTSFSLYVYMSEII
jgi:hypothetical protein